MTKEKDDKCFVCEKFIGDYNYYGYCSPECMDKQITDLKAELEDNRVFYNKVIQKDIKKIMELEKEVKELKGLLKDCILRGR